MNWWLNFYFAEGPGIEPGQPKPTGWRLIVSTLCREWWSLIVLNLVFIAACLPLVSIPAALVALFRITERIADDQPCDIVREFGQAYFGCFGRATVVAFIVAVLLTLGGYALHTYIEAATEHLLFVFPLAIAIMALNLLLVFSCNMFYLLANSEGSLLQIFKTAALSVFVQPLATFAALAANALLWLLHVAGYPSTILFAILFNFSVGGLLLVFALRGPIRHVLNHAMHESAVERHWEH